jgi:hypothetical protein
MAYRAIAYPARSEGLFVYRAWFKRRKPSRDEPASPERAWAYVAVLQPSEQRAAAKEHLRRGEPVYTSGHEPRPGCLKLWIFERGELIEAPEASAVSASLGRTKSLKELRPPRANCDPDFLGEDDIRRPRPEVLDQMFQGQRFEDDPRAISSREPIWMPAKRQFSPGGGSLALADLN